VVVAPAERDRFQAIAAAASTGWEDAGMNVEWADAWAEPEVIDVDSPDVLERVLADVERRVDSSGVATTTVIRRGEDTFSLVLGLGDVSFVQWMGGTEGAYLGVDAGAGGDDGTDLVEFSYLGHHSEVPRSRCVPHDDAVNEARHFFLTGRLSQRWEWSGYLGNTPAPEGVRTRDV
jgi:hypothetical protein